MESSLKDLFQQEWLQERIITTLEKYSDKPLKHSLVIKYDELVKYAKNGPTCADILVNEPDFFFTKAKKIMDDAIKDIPFPTEFKKKLNLRISNLPPELSTTIQNLGTKHLGKLVEFECVVSQITDRESQAVTEAWRCLYCGETTSLEVNYKSLRENYLPNCRCGHGNNKKNFVLIESECKYIDFQKIKVQELIERIIGSHDLKNPMATLDLHLEDDLTNYVGVGDKIRVIGIFRLKPKSFKEKGGGTKGLYQRYIDALYIEHLESDYEDIQLTQEEEKEFETLSKNPNLIKILTDSFAPYVIGMEKIKESLLLQHLGGLPVPNENLLKRDFIHILIIGEPGVSKSELANFDAQIAPKLLLTSGGGASGVGLTASAIETETGWTVKGGAVVMADGGVCVIDEFDKLPEGESGRLHQAMSDGRVSISKASAGSITLPARTGILAICNPKNSRFDPTQPILSQFRIIDSLRTRFDLIFVIKDVIDRKKDSNIVNAIIDAYLTKTQDENKNPNYLPPEKIKKYLIYAKKFKPKLLNKEIVTQAKEDFLNLRCGGNTLGPLSLRAFETILRLAGAYAKLRFSNKVEKEDFDKATELVMYSFNQYLIDPTTGKLDVNLINVGKTASMLETLTHAEQLLRELWNQNKGHFTETEAEDYLNEKGIIGKRFWDIWKELRNNGTLQQDFVDSNPVYHFRGLKAYCHFCNPSQI